MTLLESNKLETDILVKIYKEVKDTIKPLFIKTSEENELEITKTFERLV
jgi:hypothetical protein